MIYKYSDANTAGDVSIYDAKRTCLVKDTLTEKQLNYKSCLLKLFPFYT